MTDSLCQQFANALISKQDFSSESRTKAGLCLQDFLSCVYSTQQFPWVENALQMALQNSATSSGGAPILGTNHRVSVQDAAFVNAVAGHSLVRDDMHVGSVSHLGVVVIPAALALAEQENISGRQLLEAIICGYEAGARLGSLLMDVDTAKKIRPTGLIGAFAAAATGARLLSLDVNQTANALGLASNYLTGLNEWAAWGSEDMYFHPGIAVRNGLTAVQLASLGAVTASGSLDGQAGLFAALGKTVPEAPGLPFADGEEILQVFFKQVPACNYAQTAAQVARKVMTENPLAPESIEKITVQVPYAAAHYPGCDYSGPFNSILQARMSIHFNVASALLFGDFDDEHYREYNSAAISELAGKVSIGINDELTRAYPDKQGASISIVTADASEIQCTLEEVIPASPDEVTKRFLTAATIVLGAEKAKTIQPHINDLENAPDLNSILPTLNP